MAGKTRVALLTQTIDGRSAAGTALVARKSIEALLARRDEFELTFIHYEPSDEPIYGHGVREFILSELHPRLFNRRFFRLIYYFLTTKDGFDIMQWFQSRLYPFFWLAPAKHIVATLHGAGDLDPDNPFVLMRSVFNWTLKLFHRKVSMAIAGSDYAKKDIVRGYGFDAAHVTVINNAIDPSFTRASAQEIAQVKKKYGLPEKFFLGVARHIPTKNVIRTMRAFEQFSAMYRKNDMHFVHVGSRSDDSPKLDAIIEHSPLKDRIHIVGYVDQSDLAALYSASFALVFPILNEGFGLPAIEAMAYGTPAILSRTASPEIVQGEALLVDVLSEKEIAEAMYALANDATLRASIAQRGRAKASTFTWEATGNKLIAVYRRLSARG